MSQEVDFEGLERRIPKACTRDTELAIIKMEYQRIEEFIESAEPLLDYVRSEMARNHRMAELYQKITEQVLGAGILAMLSGVGYWALTHIKSEVGFK